MKRLLGCGCDDREPRVIALRGDSGATALGTSVIDHIDRGDLRADAGNHLQDDVAHSVSWDDDSDALRPLRHDRVRGRRTRDAGCISDERSYQMVVWTAAWS